VQPVAAAVAARVQPERRYSGAGNLKPIQAPELAEHIVEEAEVQIAGARDGTPAVMRLDDQLEKRRTRGLALLHSGQETI
jgi:hypothetical protein